MKRARAVSSWLACLACFGCAESSGAVMRMADGVRYEGRFVNPEAYAAYLMGVEHEAHGAYRAALASYTEAHAEDPDSAEIWARIGAVQCASSAPALGPKAAQTAFRHGLTKDPSYFGNYLERARCAERARDYSSALADAEAAVARRPGEESANLMVASSLQALRRSVEARLWLEGFEAYRSPSKATARVLDATRRGASSASPAPALPVRSAAFADLQSGRLEHARTQSQLELDADPTNSDAWIASLVACDALRDAQCFDTALTRLRSPSLMPSPAALNYLQELLGCRTGARVVF